MAETAADQSRTFMLWFMILLGAVLGPYTAFKDVSPLTGPVGNNPADPRIRCSAFSVPLCWFAGPWALFLMRFRDSRPVSRRYRLCIQLPWAFACASLLLHIAVAFHLGHGWSHDAAWEHTKRTGGYGDGVYVNYVVALAWSADVIWLCVAFDSYFARPRWVQWAIHGFIGFVMFNAAVVFAGWGSRARFVVALMCLAFFMVLLRFGPPEKWAPKEPPSPE